MPIKLRTSKRRADAMSELDFATIRAALMEEECPKGGNPFLHLSIVPLDSRHPPDPLLLQVFEALSAKERAAVRKRFPHVEFEEG